VLFTNRCLQDAAPIAPERPVPYRMVTVPIGTHAQTIAGSYLVEEHQPTLGEDRVPDASSPVVA
jgi:hypothetical protein